MHSIAQALVSAVKSSPAGRVYNFSAGPSTLPEEVLERIQHDIWNIDATGMGILEHSHRGPTIDKVFADAERDIRAVGSIPKNYKILFMTGGASAANYLLPMNFMTPGTTADYLVTGHWANQTWLQGQKLSGKPGFGSAHLAVDTKGSGHSLIPAAGDLKYSAKPAYAHFCSNNTLEGTQWHRVPEVPAGVPICCDMCSDIFSRPLTGALAIEKYALIYAGAQKNLGAAGTTLVIVDEAFAQSGSKDIADLLQFRTYIPDYSRPNTPPVFAIYVMGLMARWILDQGGLAKMAEHNKTKAQVVYDVLDKSTFYRPHAQGKGLPLGDVRSARSLMNVTFRLPSEELTDRFCTEAEAQGLANLKGHRNVGGIRASLYNAMPLAGAQALAQFMAEFERKNG